MNITLYDVAKRFLGLKEIPGPKDNHFVDWCLSLCKLPESMIHDETAWCSAFMVGLTFILGLPNTYSAAAISWLQKGSAIDLKDAQIGFDICIFSRPGGNHVTIFGGMDGDRIFGIGGNQNNSVSIETYDQKNLIGVRRLYM